MKCAEEEKKGHKSVLKLHFKSNWNGKDPRFHSFLLRFSNLLEGFTELRNIL